MKNFPMSATKIAELVGGTVAGNAERIVCGVSGIRDANAEQLSFVSNKKYEHLLDETNAGIVLVCKDLANASTEKHTLVICDNVDHAFAKIVAMYAEEPPVPVRGIHPSAVIAASAKLGGNVSIGANAVIEENAEIGDNTVIGAGCYIGHDAKVGADSLLYPNVTVMYRCTVGRKAIIHPGVVIGGDGFGFIPGPHGLVKVPQTGIVQIDDDVEIGANTTIDRARFGKTWIKSNVKIDNMVMVAHNVTVGESTLLIAQSGIAGSATIGRGVIIAAKSGINGHITVGDGSQVAGMSAVVKDLAPKSIALGTPVESQRDFMTRLTLPKRVLKQEARIKELEAKLAQLEKALEK